jgi:SAM-dependent methyltransferase
LVRDRYGKIAKNENAGCTSCCGNTHPKSNALSRFIGYSDEQLSDVIEGANMGLGCGNPAALGALKPGETVLDLGSGGGIDCFLAAKAVGETGYVIGVDMTPEMLSKARKNVKKMGVENVEFRLGEIEHLPVADNSVDVILSNCVINLSPEKRKVFAEAFRVLRPGGRMAISDVVALKTIPQGMRDRAVLLTGCVSGAENVRRIESMLKEVGFVDVRTRIRAKSGEWLGELFPGSGAEDYVASADIEAVKR